jgi:excisionase family DNA binding protein
MAQHRSYEGSDAQGDSTASRRSRRQAAPRRGHITAPAAELTEIRQLFRAKLQQLRNDERSHRSPTRHRTKPGPRTRHLPATNEQPHDDQLLTTHQVAQLIGVDRRTVARWADDGLPCLRTLGGHRRFRWADVRAWITGDPT